MGSGSGGGPLKIGGISGQGGGRILPGTSGGVGELIANASRLSITVVAGQPDYRPTPPFGAAFDTVFAAPGGGPGQPGKGDAFVVYVNLNTSDNSTSPVTATSGGGGGWGAAGGSGTQTIDFATQKGGNLGAAGGKAIKTNGHAVTWLGGSDRAYGAVG
ncbi:MULTISPECIES: hypothetical protein [unclassified Aliiroseovarius]|uniref:hypothetical protein n=1 Tax=unclassified Aliiroseovarius TaxID=2623558 RepID=UPI001569F062|nr:MULTISPECIES: hypothetical protein [unclassified Aliiroseovarius]NRP12172.1 hypothetical protein [Aliiroseovarius sp. xm-d-517]NRP42754.1 hypothetical protein [Aliiroseovarius sp. xm-m-339-2]NRP63666.1 hypothetical protein [Aliiroseovarius sp. xm-a-151]